MPPAARCAPGECKPCAAGPLQELLENRFRLRGASAAGHMELPPARNQLLSRFTSFLILHACNARPDKHPSALFAPVAVRSGKAKAGGGDSNFRARRLSVSDIDTSEFEKANGGSNASPAPGGRQRRMSMR